MKKTPKRFLCIALSLAMVLIAIPSAVFAEEMPSEYKEQTKDNYWAELNWYKDTTYKGVIPKCLNDYFANSRVKWANRLNEEYFIQTVDKARPRDLGSGFFYVIKHMKHQQIVV